MFKRLVGVLLVLSILLSFGGVGYAADSNAEAETLKALGLFRGTDKGFDLERGLTRAEAAAMVVRLLGREPEAEAEEWEHPFGDVPAWADGSVGYLYANDITNGISETEFGAGQPATAAQYATYLLRALGYSDAHGDFQWSRAMEQMTRLGMLSETDVEGLRADGPITRRTAVHLSYLCLFAAVKGTEQALLGKLWYPDAMVNAKEIAAAALLDPEIARFANTIGVPTSRGDREAMNPEDLFAAVSNAIFYIEITDFTGAELGSGSGFFLSESGIAVTNYHVLQYASGAFIQTPDGETHAVEGVLAVDAERDIALIKVAGSGFPYLELGDPEELRIAQRIYCIGSPLGFESSISDGLVSSVRREHYGQEFIQISAPITHGSSGGALLNEYGQVVGITSGGYEGTALNFAIPVTALQEVLRYPAMRSFRYFETHERMEVLPGSYTAIEQAAEDGDYQTLEPTEFLSGGVDASDEVDRYRFGVYGPSDILLSLTSDAAHSAALKLRVLDAESEEVLWEAYQEAGEPFSSIHGHLFEAGEYLIEVAVEDTGALLWSGVSYELFVHCEEPPYRYDFDSYLHELEPNDKTATANYIRNNTIVYGAFARYSDADCYQFAIDAPSEATIMLAGDLNPAHVLGEIISAETGKVIGKMRAYGSYYLEYEGMLESGLYYIRLTPDSRSGVWDQTLYYVCVEIYG